MRTLRPAILLALLGLACLYTYKLEIPENRSWPASGITAISIATGNGRIAVSAAAETTISARITRHCYGRDKADAEQAIRNVTIFDTIVGTELMLEAEMPSGNRSYGAHFEVTCPESLRLSLTTSNGGVSLTGMRAGADATTSNGSIALLNTAGAMNLATSNGTVTVQVHRGPINVSTSNGAVECDLAQLGPTESATLKTSNAKVTLLLPADVSATFDAKTSSSDVTITGFGVVEYEISERAHKKGRIGSGASTLQVETSNADILIRSR